MSQCLQISFGSVYNKDDILSWLESAFVLGNPFALLWFPRICGTLCPDAKILSQFKLVDRGLGEPNESYLASTIRRREFGGWSVSPRDAAEDQESIWISRDIIYQSRSSGESNDILRDSLEGFLDFYKNPDSSRRLKVVSLHGFTPVHCACLGGHLSALELLLDMGYSAVQPTTHGITPLHLCIFFAEYDLEAAVKLLLQYGPCPTETTTLIHWPDYDLVLGGSPLVWAIVTRNLNLVRILLPYYFDDRRAAIRRALENYYWEILEEILQTFPPEENLWDIYGFDFDRTPYGHWIAHGSDRFISIDRTLEVVQRHNQTPVEESSLLISNLIIMMERATTEEHFHHIERLLEIMGPSQIKQTVLSSNSALLQVAMMRAKKNTLWLQTFKALLVHYTVEELQTTSVRAVEGIRGFFLHLAVVRDCVVGARALLEKGVDPNLPARSSGITPLHICFIAKGSVEMCDTLLEFGADVNMELLRSESSPLTTLVAGRRHENSRLVDRILEFDHSEGVIIKMLLNLISGWPAPGDQTFAFLRYLLERPKIAKHLDAKFPDGFTLLHFSVSFCLVEVTQLLLEAGADPLTGFRFEEVDVYPLQVACVRGFHCGQPSKRDRLPSNTKDSVDRGKMLKIALMLLEK